MKDTPMTLREFVLHLGQNPFLVFAAQRDPVTVMEELGISASDQSILLSGEPERILAALDREEG